MKAVRIYAKEDVRVEQIEAPRVEAGKVLVTGGYAGICGSDLHLFYAPESFPWNFSEPAPLTGAKWPQILGHEFSGVVSEVGEGVANVAAGDRVAIFPYHYCGQCPACKTGDYVSCFQMAFEGIQGHTGGMTETRIVDADMCFKLPDSVSLELGALVEPMSVSWHGVALAKPTPGDTALVVGGGPIGVGAYFALKAMGVRTIIVSELSAERREVLKRIGVKHVLDPASEDVTSRVRSLSPDGLGAQVAIDAAGAPPAFGPALSALGLNGRMVIVAAYEKPIQLDASALAGNKSIRSSAVYTREEFQAVIDAMAAGVYTTEGGWIQTISLDEVPAALPALRGGSGMKMLAKV